MFRNRQTYFSDIISGKRTGVLATFAKGILQVLSWGYGTMAACRNWAFDRRYFRRYTPPVPLVISVGNIVAGGTGKTPVTLMIAREFYPHIHLAILSRGYKSRAEKLSTPTMLCKGDGPIFPAEFCGDEPYLLAQHLPKAIVIVGRNRYLASNMAAHAGAQMIILDDGMQHRRIARDLEVAVVNALDLFGQGYYLPRGFLREHVSALSRADLVIVNHVKDENHLNQLRETIKPFTKAPCMGTRMEVSHIWLSKGKELENISGKKVGIFCGIAHPSIFEDTVKELGATIVSKRFLPDHDPISSKELNAFVQECLDNNAELVLCTEKDFVKLTEFSEAALPIGWLEIELRIVAGKEHWQAFIARARKDLSKRL